MTKTYMPNYWGRLLLRELARLRIESGLMQREVEQRLKFGSQKVSRFENGGQVPGWHEVTAMLDLYGVLYGEWTYYEELWDKSKVPGWWRAFGVTNPSYLGVEHEASHKCTFELGYIPGILQTKEYTRLAFESWHRGHSAEKVERAVAIRMRRQERLTEEKPLILHAVIHEAALLCGGVDNEQLLRLAERSELPNVTIQILPLSTGLHSGLQGAFSILAFPIKDEELLWNEDVNGAHETWNREKVAEAKRRFKDLADRALDEADSFALIKKMII
jgi:transcriptional regulator with XRE-family HTH domain